MRNRTRIACPLYCLEMQDLLSLLYPGMDFTYTQGQDCVRFQTSDAQLDSEIFHISERYCQGRSAGVEQRPKNGEDVGYLAGYTIGTAVHAVIELMSEERKKRGAT